MIDRGNDREWPEELRRRLPAFRQGSLLPAPPFAYHAGTAHAIWAYSRLVREEDPLVLVELDPAEWPPYGIITTQSCDIDEAGNKPKKPWVQIAPVYELNNTDDRLPIVRRWRFNYLAPVTALGPCWVADLRIEFPVEKSWIVLHQPRDAFATPEEFRRFAEHLGRYRDRVALANEVHDQLLEPLGRHFDTLSRQEPALFGAFTSQVEHLFIAVAGDPLNPTAIQLIFVSEDKLDATLVEALEQWWETTVARREPPHDVLANRYLTFDEVRFAEQRTWYELPLERLMASS